MTEGSIASSPRPRPGSASTLPRRCGSTARRRRPCSAGSPTRCGRASIPSASSPTSSTATSTTRTSASRAATSARSTATVGIERRLRAGFDEIFRKIDETIARRRRPAAAAGRPQSRPAARLVRGSVPRGEGALSRRSSCTRCRRPRCCTSRGCRSCPTPEVIAAADRGRPRQRSPAAAPRSSSIASASCSTATARRPPTSGSASCARRTRPACARRRR